MLLDLQGLTWDVVQSLASLRPSYGSKRTLPPPGYRSVEGTIDCRTDIRAECRVREQPEISLSRPWVEELDVRSQHRNQATSRPNVTVRR